MNLTTEYPLWYLVFCLLAGAAWAGLLYFRDSRLREAPAFIRQLMTGLRFVLISALCFFLLHPLLKTIFRELEKPVIIIGQDNSESVLIGPDSGFYRTEYTDAVRQLQQQLGDKYEVSTFSFGQEVNEGLSLDFGDKQTDVSNLFDELYTRYSNRNVGAVILATDGIINQGGNPLYSTGKWNVPVYTVAMGDTAVKRDLVIANVAHNRLAYLGNQFPLEVLITARRCTGDSASLSVFKDGRRLFQQAFKIDGKAFSTTIPVLLDAESTGIQRYSVRLTELNDEISTENNRQDIFIDVLDGRQKILLLGHSPHPDLNAIRQAIATNENYEVETMMAKNFTGNPEDYNLVIFHQLPGPGGSGIPLVKKVAELNLPSLFILGQQSDLNQLNQWRTGVTVSNSRGQANEVQAVPFDGFSLFQIADDLKREVSKFPPLTAPFGNYRKSNATVSLFSQRIGLVETELPLWTFTTSGERKTGVICGEGIWRWRLTNFLEKGNNETFNTLILKTVQYLSVKADKSFFRVTSANYFRENETIVFDAEVYNESYELINEPEVALEITDSEGNAFPFTFSRQGLAYHLEAGTFPVGEYSYRAQVQLRDGIATETGEFTVSAVQVETVNSIADHQLLFNLSDRSGGTMVSPRQLADLPAMLEDRGDIASLSFQKQLLRDLINERWIFFLLLALLGSEWFLRKRNGAY